jgi:hypothetical protein
MSIDRGQRAIRRRKCWLRERLRASCKLRAINRFVVFFIVEKGAGKCGITARGNQTKQVLIAA